MALQSTFRPRHIESLIVQSRLVGVPIGCGAGQLLIQSLGNGEVLGEYSRAPEMACEVRGKL